jgi:hypothetical protein
MGPKGTLFGPTLWPGLAAGPDGRAGGLCRHPFPTN